jgi:hypothetical protein
MNCQFTEGQKTNRITFPHLHELQQIFYEMDFDELLNLIKNRIIASKRGNMKEARIHTNEMNNISLQVVTDVKQYLRNERGYNIVDVEDIGGNYSGFKISF